MVLILICFVFFAKDPFSSLVDPHKNVLKSPRWWPQVRKLRSVALGTPELPTPSIVPSRRTGGWGPRARIFFHLGVNFFFLVLQC